MNAKLERTIAEIGTTDAKIARLQEKRRALEQQKTELENADIVAMFRKEKLTEGEFRAYVESMRGAQQESGGWPPAAPEATGDGRSGNADEI